MDLDRIKRNVSKMVTMQAPEADIDAYIASEGVPLDALRAHNSVGNSDLVDDSNRSLGFGPQAVGSFASDEAEYINNAARSLYPGEPIDKAIKRFGKTKEGRLYHVGDDGKPYEVTPPGWFRAANIGQGVGPAIPAISSTVAGILSAPLWAAGPAGAATSVGVTGAAGAGGEWLRQGIGDVILGDASTGKLDPQAMAGEGVLSAAGQGLGGALGSWAAKYAAPDLARFSKIKANDLYDRADNVGIKLTPAEATGLQSQIAEQKRLRSVPEAANVMDDFYKQRNTDASNAFRGFLDTVGRPQDAGRLGERAASAADDVVSGTRATRTRETRKFFEEAARKSGPIDVSGVIGDIDAKLTTARGSARTVLETVRKFLMKPGTDQVDDSFEGLQQAKQAVSAMLDKSQFASDAQGLDRYSRAILSEVRKKLDDAITTGVRKGPGYDPYQAGNLKYKSITENVVAPTKEALGPLLRIAPENSSVVRAGRAMLDPSSRSPELIAFARTALMQKHPDVWGGLVRDFLQDEAHRALQVVASGEQANVAGKIGKALGDTEVMANMRAALSGPQMKAYEDMVDVFRAAGRAVDANSDTAFKQEAARLAKIRDKGATATAIEMLYPVNWAKRAHDFFAERNYRKQAEVIARIISSGDRNAIKQLRALKEMKAGDWRKYALLGSVLARGGYLAIDGATEP